MVADIMLIDSSRRIRVGVMTDICLYRDGLIELLSRVGADVVAIDGDGSRVGDGVRSAAPDVVLVDISMLGWRDNLRSIIDRGCDTRIVALGVVEAESQVLACAEAGVAAYVPRSASLQDLLRTMQRVLCGELVCPPTIVGSLFRRVGALAGELRPAGQAQRLTRRELQIVELIDAGLSNKQIAQRLRIEQSTVKNHVHNLLEKLGVGRRSEAAARVRGAAAGRQDLDPLRATRSRSVVGSKIDPMIHGG